MARLLVTGSSASRGVGLKTWYVLEIIAFPECKKPALSSLIWYLRVDLISTPTPTPTFFLPKEGKGEVEEKSLMVMTTTSFPKILFK